ncbi:MAG: Ig-like domain-containing protein, partial [Actinomycetaceae bacterium]|nr:Ig-like domain-containing protein [Actinomycetaceae bacterium]
YVEKKDGTDPEDPHDYKDSDGDNVPDYIEIYIDKTAPEDQNDYKDSDGDGVPDYVEKQDGTNPKDPHDYKDTDGDGLPDYVETHTCYDVHAMTPKVIPCTTDDGKPHPNAKKTDPYQADTDGDGVSDGQEVKDGTNPVNPDSFKKPQLHDAPIVKPSNGKVVSGVTGDPVGSKVTVSYNCNDDGRNCQTATGTVVQGEDGKNTFTVDLPADAPAAHGSTVTVVVTDTAGVESKPGSNTVDSRNPIVTIFGPTNGQPLTGTVSEPADIVVTYSDDKGNEHSVPVEVANVTPAVDDKGQPTGKYVFTLNLNPAPADGSMITVTATDAAGNQGSDRETADTKAPVLSIDDAQTTGAHGIGESGAHIVVTDEDGNVLGETTVGKDGRWQVAFDGQHQPQAGTTITVTATDKAGNTATATAKIVQSPERPAKPVLKPTNGKFVEGTGLPGGSIEVWTDGKLVGKGAIDADGNFSVRLDKDLPPGTIISVYVVDPATGLKSDEAQAVVIVAESPMPPMKKASHTLLSRTGVTAGLVSAVGLLVALAGAAVMFATRRRTKK